MSILNSIVGVFERIGSVADKVRLWLSYFLLFAITASAYLAVKAYSPDATVGWNFVKCAVFSLPALIWVFIWLVLGQLRQAPELARELIKDDDGLLHNLANVDVSKVGGLRGVYSTLRALRQEEGLEVMMDSIGGVGLLLNPLFSLIALLAFLGLLTVMLTAPIVMLF